MAGLVAAGAVMAGATPARADLCDDAVEDPVAVGLRDGGFDRTRGGCRRGELFARTVGAAAVDGISTDGAIGAELDVGGRFVLGPAEWGLGLRLIQMTRIDVGETTETDWSYGPIEVGGAIGGDAVLAGRELPWVVFAIAEIPYTREELDLVTGAAQVGVAASLAAHEWVALHARVAGLAGFVSGGDDDDRNAAVVGSVDGTLRTLPWLVVGAGAEAQAGWLGGLDHVAIRGGVHWRIRGPWRVEVGAMVPLAGDEPTDLVAVIGLRRDR
jgi:hypothetical protein